MTLTSRLIAIQAQPLMPAPHACAATSVVIVDPSCYTLPYDYSLCEALTQRGCRVTLARSEFLYSEWNRPHSFQEWSHFYPLTHGHAKRYRRKRAWKYAKAAEHIYCMERLLRNLREWRPDAVHFQWLPVPAIDRFYVRKISRFAPAVLTLHNTTECVHGSASTLQRLSFPSVFEDFSAIIVHSEFSKRKLVERAWVPEDRIHVIPHGVLGYYNGGQLSKPDPAREQTVLFFGLIEVYKGLDVLIEAFAKLPPKLIETTRLVVAGLPRINIQALQERARSLGIQSRLTWDLRFVAEEEIPTLFRSASVVALPYLEIDQSGVLMTAIAFDKPIVASRVGGIPETIRDGVHGRLVEPGNIESLACGLESILADSQLQRDMSMSIRFLRTGDLSWDVVSQKTIDVYKQVANREANRTGFKSVSSFSSTTPAPLMPL